MLRPLLPGALAMMLAACGSEPSAPVAVEDSAPNAPVVVTAQMGEAIFRRCVACHTVDKGGRNGVGPNLHGVVGRAVGSHPGFAYSPAMRAKGGVWDEAALDTYLKAPAQALPGGRMAFAGIPEAAERRAVILYLAAQK